MTEREICSLEYLIGTLATAYKGVIRSLIARDFCIMERDGSASLKGTVLSMPKGDYDAVLKHKGIELSRTKIYDGLFELEAESRFVRESTNLQIDIVQRGRHVGTFLLKKEKGDNVFVSALELSDEVKGLQFGVLSGRLRQRPGLLKKGERIISKIFSTKKDWGKFSNEINSFGNDLFWFDRESYYVWADALVRYAFLSAEKAGAGERKKAVENVLSMAERVLDNEKDAALIRHYIARWLSEMKPFRLDWSGRFRRSVGILSDIHRRYPDIALVFPAEALISSLEQRAARMPVIPSSVSETLAGYLPGGDLSELEGFCHPRKARLILILSGARDAASAGNYAAVFERLGSLEPHVFDDAELVETFFRVIERLPKDKASVAFADALSGMVPVFNALPEVVRKQATGHITDTVRRLVEKGMTAACEKLLDLVDAGTFDGEEIVLNDEVAQAVLGSCDEPLISHYKETLQRYLVPPPGIRGFSADTWAEIANPLHLERLSRLLRIISIDSEGLRDVMIRLICNLHVSGVFIPDERIYQRAVSSYLNSVSLHRDFLLHHLLMKRLPVFYNEVGATGNIREYTTEIDSWANDPLLYFLRKQVHVNASNYNVALIEKIMESWVKGNAGPLEGAVPDDVLSRLKPELLETYRAAAIPLFKKLGILEGRELHYEKAILIGEGTLREAVEGIDETEEIRSKFFLLLKIYRGVVGKYSPAGGGLHDREEPAALGDCINRLAELKQIVISPEKTRAEESFYFKRHIAFGIPSVMGSYHEPKFDAMAEALRWEERVKVIFESLVAEVERKAGRVLQGEEAAQWIGQLEAAAGLLEFQELRNFEVKEIVEVLRTNSLYYSQIVDLLRLWQKELTWMVESFYRTFHPALVRVLDQYPGEWLPARLRRLKGKKVDFLDRAADILIREMMAGVPGFFELDRFLGAIIAVLRGSLSQGDDLEVTKPAAGRERKARAYYFFDELVGNEPIALSPLIGGKAKNLVYLLNGGMNVPAGAVFTAGEALRDDEYTRSKSFDAALKEAVAKIERKTGAFFGDGKKPLFLSVRSGSYISMPGILSSVLYAGMNEKTLKALMDSEGDEWLGWDSMRRFIEHFGTVVFGLDASFFEETLARVVGGIPELRREEVAVAEMQAVVHGYREGLAAKGLSIPEDVYLQLKESVKAVYASWHSEKSLRFREAMEISDRWGTSVTLMQMIYGNGAGGGASVFFTRSPFTLEKGVYGDMREQATGGDLVYGRLVNRPLSKMQGPRDGKSLEEADPELFALHGAVASQIEERMGGLPQEVEVTYKRMPDGRRSIFILQTRRMEFHRGFTKRFLDVCRMQSKVMGRGAGVHGGALSGVATFSTSKERIRELRESAGMPVILIRQTASTDDVSLMPLVDGILTAGGGVASHASVLAQKFDLTAVVGCEALKIGTDEKGTTGANLGGRVIGEGSELSIDGSTGLIYSGVCSDFE